MSKTKPSAKPVLSSWTEAEQAIKRLGELQRIKAAAEARAQEDINIINAGLNEKTADVCIEITQLEKNLEDFAGFHKEEFEGESRSKDLTFGRVGYRKSPGKLVTLKGWTWDRVKDKLDELGLKKWIEKKPSIKKDIILDEFRSKAINAEKLALYGMAVDESDQFWYETSEAEAGAAAILDNKAA